MRVLYLIDSLAAGGAERSLAAMAPHYHRLGVRLDVAYLHRRDGVGPKLEEAGAVLHSLAGRGGLPGASIRAARLVRRTRPDLVHTTLFEADLVGRVSGFGTRVPVVGSLVNAAYGPEQLTNPAVKAWKVRVAQGLDMSTAFRVARFHAVSESVADVMSHRLRVSRDRIDVIPRGRDPEELGRRGDARRSAARSSLGINDGAPLVLAVGRQEHQKGFDVLIRAFASVREQLDDARLVIAGRDGGATARLQAEVAAFGLHDAVDFVGSRDDVADLLCAADVFAFPSRWEGMPGSVLEAMALETPIVASDIPPVRELLPDESYGRLVPVDDVDALSTAIVAALSDRATGPRTAAARQRFVDHFTIDRRATEMLKFYERVLSR